MDSLVAYFVSVSLGDEEVDRNMDQMTCFLCVSQSGAAAVRRFRGFAGTDERTVGEHDLD